MDQSNRTAYVAAVLDAYRATPGTLGSVRASDRRLARQLFDSKVPLEVVSAALALAATRRAARPADADPLEPVRSLYYFKPVVNELLKHYPDPSLFAYIQDRFQRLNAGDWPPPPQPAQHASGVDDSNSPRS
jgi:hypothetical protein